MKCVLFSLKKKKKKNSRLLSTAAMTSTLRVKNFQRAFSSKEQAVTHITKKVKVSHSCRGSRV